MNILEMYNELLAEGLDEDEAAILAEELFQGPPLSTRREENKLIVLMVIAGMLLCIILTIGGL